MITIDNSVLNLKLANTLLKNIQSFQTTMQRMVTGLRINKPEDDTAGFYISQKLGGTGTTLIGDIIETQFQTANNFHLGASLSFVLMILIFICLAVMNKFSDDDGGVVI